MNDGGWMKYIIFILILMMGCVTSSYAEEIIAFSQLDKNGYWQIWTMHPDGTGQKQLTGSSIDKRDPVPIDDNRKILFRTNNSRLYVMDADGRNEKEIMDQYHLINDPHYSDIHKTLIFTRFDPVSQDVSQIWKTNDWTKSKAFLLTKYPALKYQPKFSADGEWITFVQASKDKLTHSIWIMDKTGKQRRQLTFLNELSMQPSFSPDGKFITFMSSTDGGDYEIYRIRLSDGEVHRLTDNDVADENPVFSPDSESIMFVSYTKGVKQLWTMKVDGTELKQLTFGDMDTADPTWLLGKQVTETREAQAIQLFDKGMEKKAPVTEKRPVRTIPASKMSYDAETGEIKYTLHEPALVRIRIGLADGGPMLANVIDWETRTEGEHIENWHFTDQEKKATFKKLKNYVVTILAIPLDARAEMEKYSDKIGFRQAPRFDIAFPKASGEKSYMGAPVLSGNRVPIRVTLKKEDRAWLTQTKFEMALFVDQLFLMEDEEGINPYTYHLNTTGLTNGHHTITVNVVGYEGEVGSHSVMIYVKNKSKKEQDIKTLPQKKTEP